MLYISARLVAAAAGEFESFDYDADYRDAKGAPRFFTTPRALSMATLDALGERSDELQRGWASLMTTMMRKLGDDLMQAIAKTHAAPRA